MFGPFVLATFVLAAQPSEPKRSLEPAVWSLSDSARQAHRSGPAAVRRLRVAEEGDFFQPARPVDDASFLDRHFGALVAACGLALAAMFGVGWLRARARERALTRKPITTAEASVALQVPAAAPLATLGPSGIEGVVPRTSPVPANMQCDAERWIEIAAAVSAQHGRRVGVIVVDVEGVAALAAKGGGADAEVAMAELCREIRTGMRPSDLVEARDGREIIVCAPFISLKDEIFRIGERVRGKMQRVEARLGVDLSPRLGIAMHPIDGYTGEELIAAAKADLAGETGYVLDAPATAPRLVKPAGPAAEHGIPALRQAANAAPRKKAAGRKRASGAKPAATTTL